jgi:hypothetical protein
VDAALAFKEGQGAKPDVQNENDCALSPNCTLNDSDVNGVGQMQAQALNELSAAGSQAGEAIYTGPNVAGPGPAAAAFDITVLLSNVGATINDFLALPGKIIQLFAPTANAASLPSSEATPASQK